MHSIWPRNEDKQGNRQHTSMNTNKSYIVLRDSIGNWAKQYESNPKWETEFCINTKTIYVIHSVQSEKPLKICNIK